MARHEHTQSLSEFQQDARATIARLRETGRAAILTIEGEAEIVLQDARAYRRLLQRVEEAERLLELGQGIAEYRSDRVRDIDDALADLEARYLRSAEVTTDNR